MEIKKIDKAKLRTIKNYATLSGYSVQHVYRLVKDKTLKTTLIDGVTFIQL